MLPKSAWIFSVDFGNFRFNKKFYKIFCKNRSSRISNDDVLFLFFSIIRKRSLSLSFAKSKSKEAHIQARVIFTNNDVMINLGVIIAGVLVYFTHSKMPDLAIGPSYFYLGDKRRFFRF